MILTLRIKFYSKLITAILASTITVDYNLDGDINGVDKVFWSNNNGVFTEVK